MNTSHGWIKLYRCLLEDAVCQKSAYFHLWVTLLLMAAHKQRDFIFNNQIHTLRPGQLITGRKKLSKLTGIPETTIRRILKCFENGHMIQRKITSKYTIITIINWENYQSESYGEQHRGQQMDIKRPTSDQQADTYKNDKNEKNDKTHRCDYLTQEELEIRRADEAFEIAKAEFLRRAALEEKASAQQQSK